MNKEIYALESIEIEGHSVFLAGPTPRDKNTPSWRPDMIDLLRSKGYTGDILIPEKRGDYLDYEYETNTVWEVSNLIRAEMISFWIPRSLPEMPAFTSNIEFGEFMHSGKIVLGYPKDAEKMRYLQVRAQMHGIPVVRTMEELVDHIIADESDYLKHKMGDSPFVRNSLNINIQNK